MATFRVLLQRFLTCVVVCVFLAYVAMLTARYWTGRTIRVTARIDDVRKSLPSFTVCLQVHNHTVMYNILLQMMVPASGHICFDFAIKTLLKNRALQTGKWTLNSLLQLLKSQRIIYPSKFIKGNWSL